MTTERAREGSLLVAGFLGRGNAGDEAMLQCIYEAFSGRFDIVVSVDGYGAKDGFWDWYPYDRAKVVHRGDIAVFDKIPDIVGMIVGGGGLPTGFAADQTIVARSRGLPVVLAGVDLWTPDPEPGSPQVRAMREWLLLFDKVFLRTGMSVRYGNNVGVPAVHAGDWALRLITDEAGEVAEEPQRALVVLREDELSRLPEDFHVQVEDLVRGLEAQGFRPVFVPFAPEDERFLREVGLWERLPVERAWWNARRLKQLVARSGLTVSVGRLHPIIFSAGTGRAVAAVAPPRAACVADGMRKVREMAAELGISYHDGIASFLASLAASPPVPADADGVAAARERLDAAVEAMRGVFLRHQR